MSSLAFLQACGSMHKFLHASAELNGKRSKHVLWAILAAAPSIPAVSNWSASGTGKGASSLMLRLREGARQHPLRAKSLGTFASKASRQPCREAQYFQETDSKHVGNLLELVVLML